MEVPGAVVLVLAGGAAWLLGSAVLPAGTGTVVLAAGLVCTGWLVSAVRRRGPAGPPLDRERGRRVLRLVAVGVGSVIAAGVLLDVLEWGELAVPVSAALVGALLIPLAGLVGMRILVALGASLMVLGALGAVLALGTAGPGYPQGMVGLVGGLLLWATGAYRAGLLDELRARARR